MPGAEEVGMGTHCLMGMGFIFLRSDKNVLYCLVSVSIKHSICSYQFKNIFQPHQGGGHTPEIY